MQRTLSVVLRDKGSHWTVSPGKRSILSSACSSSSQGFGPLAESKQLACTLNFLAFYGLGPNLNAVSMPFFLCAE